jgi:hypothetical protein
LVKYFCQLKKWTAKNTGLILLASSFISIIVFKAISRFGAADLIQAKTATAAALILAIAQLLLSKKFVRRANYLEKFLLGYFIIGAVWIFMLPVSVAYFFVDYSIVILYFVLFLMMIVPQLIGYDSFINSIAKYWQSDELRNTPHYKTINLRSTYVFSFIMLMACFSSWIGDSKPLFSILIPLILIKFIGIPFVRRYPKYYCQTKKSDAT